jgi:hypothetical protein
MTPHTLLARHDNAGSITLERDLMDCQILAALKR